MAVPLFNIGGLASGLDTSSIISSILDVERIPIQQLEARKADHQVVDSAWQSIKARYSAIRTALDELDSASEFDKFASVTSSNADAVTAAATGAATPGSVSFTVDQLAANHQVASATNYAGSDDLVGAGDFTITVDGTDYTVTATADTTVSQLAAAINGLDADVSASVISVDGTNYKLLLSSDDTGNANVFTTAGTIASLGTMDIIQQGLDAEVTIGSGAAALTLSRSSNTFSDLLSGVSIELNQTTTAAVTVSAQRDVGAAATAIQDLITEVNSTLSTIGDLTNYSPEADAGGPLAGNSTARSLALDLRSAISGAVNSSSSTYPVASSVGISLNRQGTFDVDESKLRAALEDDFDTVVGLLVESGAAADSRLGFVTATSATVEGDYSVVVTQAATRAQATSSAYAAPAADSTFQVVVGTTTVDVSIAAGQAIGDVVNAINTALSSAGATAVSAEAVNISGSDYLQLTHSGFGSASDFEVIGDPFGLAGTYAGTDVAGTIGGETASGTGRSLTATAGDPEGLVVLITATAAEVSGAGGSLPLGMITYARGVLGSLDQTTGFAEGSGGRIARAQDLAAAQIGLIDDRIEVLEDRLDRREAMLIRQYAALESAMATLQSQSAWLTSQLAALNGGGES
jgi:flagellar hook-associated protein 2